MREVDELERSMQGARGAFRSVFGPMTLDDARQRLIAEHAAAIDREFVRSIFERPTEVDA